MVRAPFFVFSILLLSTQIQAQNEGERSHFCREITGEHTTFYSSPAFKERGAQRFGVCQRNVECKYYPVQLRRQFESQGLTEEQIAKKLFVDDGIPTLETTVTCTGNESEVRGEQQRLCPSINRCKDELGFAPTTQVLIAEPSQIGTPSGSGGSGSASEGK